MSPHRRRDDRFRLGISAAAVLAISALCAFFGAQYAVQHSDQRAALVSQKAQAAIQTAKDKANYQTAVARYHESLRSCARGNKLRRKLNTTSISILRDFLKTALAARLAAASAATDPAVQKLNHDAADAYVRYIAQLKPLPLTDCSTAFAPPAPLGGS